jgi:hypothetical protein
MENVVPSHGRMGREKRKRSAISRSIMEDLKEQYLDTPQELSHKVPSTVQCTLPPLKI